MTMLSMMLLIVQIVKSLQRRVKGELDHVGPSGFRHGVLGEILGPTPHLLPIAPERERKGCQGQESESDERVAPANPQVLVHAGGRERQGKRKKRSDPGDPG